MGLFYKFLGKKKIEEGSADPFYKLVDIISNHNEKICEEMKLCKQHRKYYFESHRDLYTQWGIDEFSEDKEICFIALVALLEKENIVCIRDYNDEKEDFIYYVNNLRGCKDYGLSIQDDWLNEDDDITVWANILQQQWKEYHLAAIDMNSDSYVLFVCDTNTLDELKNLGNAAGIHIDLAKVM